jgi:hypothetical protein
VNIIPVCESCSDVYIKAYAAVRQQLGTYLLFFAIAVVLSAIVFRLYEKGRVSDKRFKWFLTIIIGLELLWVFNLIGIYFLVI